MDMGSDPHARGATVTAGVAPEEAALTVVLIHGRGASARSILSIAPEIAPENAALAWIAPEAAGQTWEPDAVLERMERNQPWLDSALRRIAATVDGLLARKVPAERIALLGFSQGACLATEFAARHTRRYAGVIGLSGGLIGPPGTPRVYPGDLAGTPVFLGCSDPDPHIPFERVEETAAVLRRMGAVVDLRRYPGLGHTVNADEVAAVRALLQGAVAAVG